jgi:acyl carrier protein
VGEVQVRGPQVFAGYVDEPELTAAAFVDGWFRLGDLGRLDDAGELEVVGRLRDTINRGGEKLSPLEIDAVMQALPGVAEAAAFGVPHAALGEEVVAAVVRERDSALTAGEIIDAVRKQLGDRRAPRRVWFVDALPRTEAGKLKRSALPGLVMPGGSPTPPVNGASRASTPLEIALTALWTSTLRRGTIGVDENFFMLGGDSLRGATLLMNVRTAFGIDIPVQALFDEANTIAGMARRIERERATR